MLLPIRDPVPHSLVLSLWTLALLAALPGSAADIVAHRGASQDAPENTLAAFHTAWQKGADAIEGDFLLTKDGRIVCLHDASTKRTTGNASDLTISQSNFDQLTHLDVGSWKDPRWHQQRIPTLEEVLATVPPGKKILIEIKCGPEILDPLKKTLARASLNHDQTIIISFNADVIAAVKKYLPHRKAYWLTGFKEDKKTGQWAPTLAEILDTLKKTGADGLDVQANPQITREMIQQVHQAGYEVHVWTVDDPQQARHWADLGVQSITTNQPWLIRDALASP